MNSCILMAEIVQEPQLRFTPDQTAIAEMLVQFSGIRAEDPPATLKVVGWGNLAQEIQQQYHQGDRVIIEGRLSMNTVDRPEGFKEKRAELTVQRIHSLGDGVSMTSTTASTGNATSATHNSETTSRSASSRGATPRTPEKVATTNTVNVVTDFYEAETTPESKPQSPTYTPLPSQGQDIDDIPF